jgi:hypothetical protein
MTSTDVETHSRHLQTSDFELRPTIANKVYRKDVRYVPCPVEPIQACSLTLHPRKVVLYGHQFAMIDVFYGFGDVDCSQQGLTLAVA